MLETPSKNHPKIYNTETTKNSKTSKSEIYKTRKENRGKTPDIMIQKLLLLQYNIIINRVLN